MPDYLTNVNPAGTVPVLVHNGHPVYESHEQILYIDRSGASLELQTKVRGDNAKLYNHGEGLY